jgi:Tol biopolymer transport system component
MKKIILFIIGIVLATIGCPHPSSSFLCRLDAHQELASFQATHPCSLYQSESLYETLETPHFIIYYDESHKIFALEVADIAESIYDDATSFMRCNPSEKVRIDILASTFRIFPWESSFAHRAYARSDWRSIILIYGCPFSTEVCGWNYLDVKRALSYEMNHVLLYWILEDSTYIDDIRNNHQWIIAGLAAYYEEYAFSSRGYHESMCEITQYLGETNFPESLEEISLENYDRLSSPLAGSIIHYMFDKHGEDKFYTFLDSLQKDSSRTATRSVENALQKAFGMTKGEFEKEWASYVKDKYQYEAREFNATQITYPPSWKVPSSWHDDEILYVSDINGNLDIFIMNTDGTGIQQLTENESSDFDAKFSPDGEKIAFTSLRKDYANIYRMELDGRIITQLTFGEYMDFMGSWSPDGRKVVFTSTRSGNYDIYCMNADGSHITQLTFYEGDDGWPVFSPDGQRIVFVSDRGGSYDVYAMDRDGTNIQQLTFTRADENFPMYSPDGKKIAFISRDELTELCIMNSDGKKRESIVISPNFVVDTMARQTDRILGYPVWSPDGDQIAFTAVNQIFVVSVDQHISRWVILPLIVMGCILMWGVRRIQSRIPGQ